MKGFITWLHNSMVESTAEKVKDNLFDLVGTDNKIDEFMWDFFEKNMPEIYAGDAIPEDYLEKISDKNAIKLYADLKKKFKLK